MMNDYLELYREQESLKKCLEHKNKQTNKQILGSMSCIMSKKERENDYTQNSA